jgi:radical SAM protein with 4Fe4S-binding SPASM domain
MNVLVSTRTYDDLPRIAKWCARHKVSRLLFLKFKLTENNRTCGAMVLSREQERGLLPILRRLARSSGVLPMLDCSFFPALAVDRPRKRDLERFDVNGCQGAGAYLAVTVDGMVKPCSFWPEPLGGLELLTREAWVHADAFRAFRAASQSAQCRGCRYRDLCRGGCRVGGIPCCHPEDDQRVAVPGGDSATAPALR